MWLVQCQGSPGNGLSPSGRGGTQAPPPPPALPHVWGGMGGGRWVNISLSPPPRCLQTVQLDRHIQLLDCPGVVMETGAPTAAAPLRGALAPQRLRDPLTPAAAILRRCPPEQVGSAPLL